MKKKFKTTALRPVISLALSCSIALLTAACGGGGGGTAEAPPVFTPVTRQATLTTVQETPAPTLPDAAAATPGGTASFTLYSTNKLRGSMTLTGFTLSGTPQTTAVTAAHIHDGDVGVAGGVVVALLPDASKVVWSLPPNTVLDDAKVARFKAGGYYVNAHTNTNAPGVIRGQLISFADNVQAIFTASCALSTCHVPSGIAPMPLQAGASIGNLVNVNSVASTPSGVRVVPGNAANSVLFKRINGAITPTMPLNRGPLAASEQNLIKVWIDMGANNN